MMKVRVREPSRNAREAFQPAGAAGVTSKSENVVVADSLGTSDR